MMIPPLTDTYNPLPPIQQQKMVKKQISLTCIWKTVIESSSIKTRTDIILPILADMGVLPAESSPPDAGWESPFPAGAIMGVCRPVDRGGT